MNGRGAGGVGDVLGDGEGRVWLGWGGGGRRVQLERWMFGYLGVGR